MMDEAKRTYTQKLNDAQVLLFQASLSLPSGLANKVNDLRNEVLETLREENARMIKNASEVTYEDAPKPEAVYKGEE